ncbi:3'-5' exoribonuclease [Anaerosporobacter mobilis DSM 15930]|jgi:3'-5' exoribonuclease|uniref:3'-5' exoribonuclease n=1 Tax=Anaerosporobacter mobilis DSM 15930 TaxID=1120996 RepID=A0A1M7FWS4_9FIRM|nr:HD domain-containing protein [Anaerosporobacter mobilis]SHM08375.1 3'-5' exoribonuclease [Anaerosporobacter mobilis DSM 15930]
MRYINELREGEMLSETYLCKSKQSLKTKAGKSYYSLLLQDKTGTLDAKVWELSNGIENFDSMDYIHIEGQITSFQNTLQLNIKRVRKSQEGEYDPSDFVPTTTKNIDEMYNEILTIISKMTNPYLSKLVNSFFVEDKEFIKAFKYHSAAKTVHHGFVGGLVEHTLGVTKLCEYMAANYPLINRDLLISAALFHDLGKLDEISTFPENDYTDDGQLLGHIYIGTEKVGAIIRTIPNFPKSLENELKHCILSHHGELEYGSPKKPALIEAVALTYADNTDAKLQTMIEILNGADDKSEWLGYNKFFESNIRRSSK